MNWRQRNCEWILKLGWFRFILAGGLLVGVLFECWMRLWFWALARLVPASWNIGEPRGDFITLATISLTAGVTFAAAIWLCLRWQSRRTKMSDQPN